MLLGNPHSGLRLRENGRLIRTETRRENEKGKNMAGIQIRDGTVAKETGIQRNGVSGTGGEMGPPFQCSKGFPHNRRPVSETVATGVSSHE